MAQSGVDASPVCLPCVRGVSDIWEQNLAYYVFHALSLLNVFCATLTVCSCVLLHSSSSSSGGDHMRARTRTRDRNRHRLDYVTYSIYAGTRV